MQALDMARDCVRYIVYQLPCKQTAEMSCQLTPNGGRDKNRDRHDSRLSNGFTFLMDRISL